MAKTRKRATKKQHLTHRKGRAVRRRRNYGTIPVRKNFLPALAAIPFIPIILWGGGLFAAWKTYSTASAIGQTLSRPTVLIGGGVGLVYGYKSSDSMFARLAYMAAGIGAGMLLDKLIFPEEQEVE
jgi:hypothetical protein